ncbi:MAG: methyltransferase domain-containing protein [Gemmatimonadaceae bacterium]
MTAAPPTLDARARQSRGTSGDAIYAMVEALIAERHAGGGVLVDVGCGTGTLWRRVRRLFARGIGVDAVQYQGLETDMEFVAHDLDQPPIPLAANSAQIVTAVETIEHLENPWAFGRELARLVTPGGWVVVTTPNQLSVLSKATLMLKNAFNAFQAPSYPAHRTALLEIDLRRVMAEAGLEQAVVRYSGEGRWPLSGGHYPRIAGRWWPRGYSDNVAIAARKPEASR